MTYIKDISIETFKGIENFSLDECGDVNIIVGDNNTCKTTVLEAIQFFQYPNDFKEMIRISRKRDISARAPKGITVLESFLKIFNAKQDDIKKIYMSCNNFEKRLEIVGEVKEVYITEYELNEMKKYSRVKMELYNGDIPVKEFRGNIVYNDRTAEVFINEITDIYRFNSDQTQKKEKAFKMQYISSIDHINEMFQTRVLSEAILNNDKCDLLGLLNLFDYNIIGLEILPNRNNNAFYRPEVLIKHKIYGFMPLSSFGDGLKKVITLAAGILSINNGILLIDEIETAIHTSALGDVFKWLLRACKDQNIQIFATSHSDEALNHFLSNYKNFELNAAIYRLEADDNRIISRRFSGDKAARIIQNGGDLR